MSKHDLLQRAIRIIEDANEGVPHGPDTAAALAAVEEQIDMTEWSDTLCNVQQFEKLLEDLEWAWANSRMF